MSYCLPFMIKDKHYFLNNVASWKFTLQLLWQTECSMQDAYSDRTKQNHWGTHKLKHTSPLPAYLRIKQPKKLCGVSGTRCPHNLPSLPPDSPFPPVFFWSFLSFFFSSLLSFQTLNFLAGVPRCCRGTNRLFCQIAKNFKVCLTCTLGRPAVGARGVSHWDLRTGLKSTVCIYTINIQRSSHFAYFYMAPLN